MSRKFNSIYIGFFLALAYLLINIFFYYPFWKEIASAKNPSVTSEGEVFAAEWAMEHVYRNISAFRNPFVETKDMFYPFGMSLATTDSGYGFLFLFLRPYFSPYQSLLVIVVLSIIIANLGMYFFIRRIGTGRIVAFFIGLFYGYTTFLMPRMGHLNYTAIYLFPWFFVSILISAQKKTSAKIRLLALLSASFLLVSALYLNLYYFVVVLIACITLGFYFLISNPGQFVWYFKKNRYSLTAGIFFTGILLSPWILALKETSMFDALPRTPGWAGAIEFSADLFGLLIPSKWGFFHEPVWRLISGYFTFAVDIFERYAYPGLFILGTYMLVIRGLLIKKFPKIIWFKVKPFFLTAIIFWILSLGPFLHILGKLTSIPLPYFIFRYLPFLNNIRVPGRLIIGFIFFSYIVGAYYLQFYIERKSKPVKKVIIFFLVCLFIVDHYFKIVPFPARVIPQKIYQQIKNDDQSVSVMELPFVIRDGLTYFGRFENINFIAGQAIHGKPVIGGYSGRMADFKRDYYMQNPFFGYMGRLIDNNRDGNPILNASDRANWQKINVKASIDAIDLLSIKYIIVDKNQVRYQEIVSILRQLGYKKNLDEGNFKLWVRNPGKMEFAAIKIGDLDDNIFLGEGWYNREQSFRWSDKTASVLVKTGVVKKNNLVFKAESFYKNQAVTVYMDRNKIGELVVGKNERRYMIPIDPPLTRGIHTIHFIFDNSYQPDKFFNNGDSRDIAAKFTYIGLE